MIYAKPIVDMLVAVEDIPKVDRQNPLMQVRLKEFEAGLPISDRVIMHCVLQQSDNLVAPEPI